MPVHMNIHLTQTKPQMTLMSSVPKDCIGESPQQKQTRRSCNKNSQAAELIAKFTPWTVDAASLARQATSEHLSIGQMVVTVSHLTYVHIQLMRRICNKVQDR